MKFGGQYNNIRICRRLFCIILNKIFLWLQNVSGIREARTSGTQMKYFAEIAQNVFKKDVKLQDSPGGNAPKTVSDRWISTLVLTEEM